MSSRILIAGGLTGVIAIVAPARADEFHDTYQQALTDFKAKAYAKSREEFQHAYVLQAAPIILFNIAQTYRLEGNVDEAIKWYHRFLDDSQVAADMRAEAEGYVKELEAATSAHEPTQPTEPPPPTQSAPPPAPAPSPAPPSPTTSLDVKPGIEIAPPPHRRASLVAPLVLGGGGLVLGGVGLGFELLAESSYNDAKAATTNPTRDSKYDSANTQRHVAQGFAVGGALSVGAAVWVYVRGRHAEDNRTTVVATPGGFAVVGRF